MRGSLYHGFLLLGLLLSGDPRQLGLSLRSSHRFGPEGLPSAPLAEVKPRAAKLEARLAEIVQACLAFPAGCSGKKPVGRN